MPYGTGPLLRQALVRATPLQRVLIAIVMIAAGTVLAVMGHVAAVILAVAGVLLLVRMVKARMRRRHKTSPSASNGQREEATDGS